MINKPKRFYLISALAFLAAVSSLESLGYAEDQKQAPSSPAAVAPLPQRDILIVAGDSSDEVRSRILTQTKLINQNVIGDPMTLRTVLAGLPSNVFSPVNCIASHAQACLSPLSMIFEQLNIQKIFEINTAHDDKGYTAVLRIHDGDKITSQSTFRESSAQSLADTIVRYLFKNTARILIKTTPPATLWINGQRQPGETPIQASVQAGPVTIRLEADGYQSVERSFETKPNMGYSLAYELPTSVSSLRVVNAPKTAQIYLDGRFLGQADKTYPVKEGHYLVEIYAEGFRPYSESIDIKKGMTATFTTPELTPNRPLFNNFFSLKPIQVRIVANLGWDHNTLTGFNGGDIWLGGYPESEKAQNPTEAPHIGYNGFTYGVGADASYTYRYFAFTPLSFSLTSSTLNGKVYAHFPSSSGRAPVQAIAQSITSLRITPAAIGLRYPTKYFVLGADLGLSLHADFLSVTGTSDPAVQQTYTQTYGTFHAEVFGNIHTHTKFFYTLGSRFEFDIPSNTNRSTFVWALTAGIGLSYDDFLGFQPKPPINLESSDPNPKPLDSSKVIH